MSRLDREIIETEDGSTSIFVPELNEHYHSTYGAIIEAKHIYIEAGLNQIDQERIKVLEAGFGTGLNTFLTLLEAEHKKVHICYHSWEKYPLKPEEYDQLNFSTLIDSDSNELFKKLHTAPWNEAVKISPYFTLVKQEGDFNEIDYPETFDLIYYDAFNPDVQPHLWSEELLGKFAKAMKPGALLLTYCVKGVVKQALRSVGMQLKRLPGPPGKRQILRAIKPIIVEENILDT